MDRTKAEAVLAAINAKYEVWNNLSREEGCTAKDYFPQLVPNWHDTSNGRTTPFAIKWEINSPDDWALKWENAQDEKLGVICEPIFSFVLGIYDDGPFKWERVKRGGKFAHQTLLTAGRKPETCYITRVIRYGGSVETVYYRSGHPQLGWLNKASAEYFERHVLSFWED